MGWTSSRSCSGGERQAHTYLCLTTPRVNHLCAVQFETSPRVEGTGAVIVFQNPQRNRRPALSPEQVERLVQEGGANTGPQASGLTLILVSSATSPPLSSSSLGNKTMQ